MFQSLIGFKINWNFYELCTFELSLQFQSLIGFKINWNPGSITVTFSYVPFQSLIGFKINWNLLWLAGDHLRRGGFNP